MNDELLRYYNDELEYLRQSGAEFAQRHPKVAASLKVDQSGFQDPMVERLVASFSFLTAKIQRQLDADHKELAYEMLSLLYPQLLLPIPSMMIAQFKPDIGFGTGVTINQSEAFNPTVPDASHYVFTTAYDTHVYPLAISNIEYGSALDMVDTGIPKKTEKSFLNMVINKTQKDFNFTADDTKPLRLYLNVQKQYATSAYELLFKHSLSITILSHDKKVIGQLSPSAIKSVGFGHNESMLPYPRQAFLGYRLISEFCHFSEKFMFADIVGLASLLADYEGENFYLVLGFDDFRADMVSAFHKESLLLGCVPMVNLYKKSSDPVRIDHMKTRYHLPVERYDISNHDEIYQITSLNGWHENGEDLPFFQAYGLNYSSLQSAPPILWQAIRQPAWAFARSEQGDEMMVQFSYPNHADTMPEPWTVNAELICFNRDISAHFTELTGNTSDITTCVIKPPTATIRPNLDAKNLWQLINAMTLLQQSLTNEEYGIDTIKKLVQLFNQADNPSVNLLLDKFVTMSPCLVTRRFVQDGGLSFVQGMGLTLTCKTGQVEAYEYYLLGSVLSYFLNQFCGMNSFVELILKDEHDQWEEVWKPLSLRGICPIL